MIKPLDPRNEEISQAAIDFELRRLIKFYSQYLPRDRIEAQMDSLRKKAREQAIGVRSLVREARRQAIEVPDSEVDTAVREIVSAAGGREAFLSMLRKQGISEDLLVESVRDSKRVDRLLKTISASVPEPTEEDVRDHYKRNCDNYSKPERRRAQHILIKPDSNSEHDRARAREQLLDIRQKCKTGAGFSDLAAAHSQCPSGKKTGGSIGWINRGMMVPEFENVLFSTAIGQVSDVTETGLGFHLILPSASEPGGPAEFEEVKNSIRDFLVHERRGKAVSAYVKKLNKK
jgi:parvulin-like peptidyl-prolyl isomerase